MGNEEVALTKAVVSETKQVYQCQVWFGVYRVLAHTRHLLPQLWTLPKHILP